MRIGIDARMYGPETAKGLGRYIERLLHHLEQRKFSTSSNNKKVYSSPPKADPPLAERCREVPLENIADDFEFVVFLRRENFDSYQPRSARFRKVLADFPWYGWQEQVIFPRLIERERVDFMHFPHFNVPLWYRGKFVVTIHDLILFRFPTVHASLLGSLTFWFKYCIYRVVLSHAVKRALRVITVSQNTKHDLLRAFPFISGKIRVVYEGADSVEAGQMKLPEETLERFGITRPYCLYVGNAYPHKNLERLIAVFQRIWEKTDRSYQLVLVGKHDYFYKRLQRVIARSTATKQSSGLLRFARNDNSIIFTNHVSQGFLADLYRNARVYVFPSLLEGFGLPGLEAMMYGLPVISSNRGALPEIYGDAALYFDPEDEADMEGAIERGLTDAALRERLIAAGKDQAAKYRWDTCARETMEVYKEVLDKLEQ